MSKVYKLGNLIAKPATDKQGNVILGPDGKQKTWVSLALGNKGNKDKKYDVHVELTVKDGDGNVLHRQNDGFISLVDPRTQPDELLASGFITEERADQMRAGWDKLETKHPDFAKTLKYNMQVVVKS